MTRIRSSILLLLLVAASLAGPASSSTSPQGKSDNEFDFGPSMRIIGGTPVDRAYPFYAMLEQGCGGSLIWDDFVLSAGHCRQSWSPSNVNGKPFDRRIWLGGTRLEGGLTRTMVDQFRHPNYYEVMGTPYSDYLLVKLSSSALLRTRDELARTSDIVVEPIVLNGQAGSPLGTGQPLQVMGFGRTSLDGYQLQDVLQEVTVHAIPDDTCQQLYDNASPGIAVDPEVMFCAGNLESGGKDSCQGDSGGPIIDADGVQLGVVSFGISCGNRLYPGVYSKVDAKLNTWIQQVLCKNSCYPSSECDPNEIHPCAKLNQQQIIGPGTLTLTILHDMYPAETAILLTHMETGLHVFYQPFKSFPNAGSVPPPMTHTLTNLHEGTYLMEVGDSGFDGMCCWYGRGTIELAQPGVGLVHRLDGDFEGYTDLTFQVTSTGAITNVRLGTGESTNSVPWEPDVPDNQQYDDFQPADDDSTIDDGWLEDFLGNVGTLEDIVGSAFATNSPDADPLFPGEMASGAGSVVINLKYDSFREETMWILAMGSATATERSGTTWTTVNSGTASDSQNSVDSFVQNGLNTGIYILQIQDSSNDGMCCWFGYGWGTLTSSTDVLWSTNGDFDEYTQVIFEVDGQGRTSVVDGARRRRILESFENSQHESP